jgi:cytochrome oxidase Cu insertion factor (SCO1/SenC/PrrC family)
MQTPDVVRLSDLQVHVLHMHFTHCQQQCTLTMPNLLASYVATKQMP